MSFKLSYSLLHWDQVDLPKTLERLKVLGWDGWECRFALEKLPNAKVVRNICDSIGMPISAFVAAGFPEQKDVAVWDLEKRRMDFAKEAGADCFMYMNVPLAISDGLDVTIEEAASRAELWASYGKSIGMDLSYHIHTNHLINSWQDFETYMMLAQSIGLCFDVSHATMWGQRAATAIPNYGGRINYVHLHDYRSFSVSDASEYEPDWVEVGDCDSVGFASVRDALHAINFDRWITAVPTLPRQKEQGIEVELDKSSKVIKYLRQQGY